MLSVSWVQWHLTAGWPIIQYDNYADAGRSTNMLMYKTSKFALDNWKMPSNICNQASCGIIKRDTKN